MKEFAVIGLGRFGMSVATSLFDKGFNVLGVDLDSAKVQAAADRITHVVEADATDRDTLKSLGIRNFDAVVVGVGELEDSVLTTLTLKELGVKEVVVKSLSDSHRKILELIGADRIVFPERDMGCRVARNLSSANLVDYLELTPEFSIVEVKATAELIDRTLAEINFRSRYGTTVIGIKRSDELMVLPGGDDCIKEGDILLVLGPNDQLQQLPGMN